MKKNYNVIAIVSIILYLIVKLFRKYEFECPSIIFILGIAPNFLAPITFLSSIMNNLNYKGQYNFYKLKISYLFICFLTSLSLTIEEFFPILGNSKCFDLFDLLATYASVCIAVIWYKYFYLDPQ